MLVLLSPALRPDIQRLKDDPAFLEALDNLAISFRKGVHIVSGPPDVLAEIIGITSGDLKGTFKQIRQGYHQEASVRDLMSHVVTMEPQSDMVVHTRTANGRTSFHVPYRYFSAFETAHSSRLVGEDESDVRIYGKAAAAFLSRNRQQFRSIVLSIQAHGGGGSSTADHYRSHSRRGPTLCIVDSDKRAPAGAEGSTVAAVRRAQSEHVNTSVCHLEVLACHELENLLPGALLLDCLLAEDGAELRKRWLQSVACGLLNGPERFRYVDLKAGITGYDIHTAHPPEAEYLRSVAAALQQVGNLCETSARCDDRKSCTCFDLLGIGEGALARVGDRCAVLTEQKLGEYFFPTDGTGVWTQLARLIISWGCAYAARRV